MRKFLIAAIALFMGTGFASAADLPVKARPMPVAVFSWTGFYIGGNLGGAWAHHNFNDVFFPNLSFDGGTGNGRFIGGGQVGFNYQINQFVWGVEGTFDWASTNNGNGTGVILPGVLPVTAIQVSSNDTWISTIAGRASAGRSTVRCSTSRAAAAGSATTDLPLPT